MQTSCASAQERFITSFAEYAYAVIDEASDRAKGRVRTIEDYLRLARLAAGPYPCFFPLEMDLDIPDEVMTHPSLEVIRSMTAESLVLGNVSAIRICSMRMEKADFVSCKDLYSYNIEQAAGHGGHNVITVVMNENGVDLNGALRWVSEYHEQILSEFRAQYRTLPSWGRTIDLKVKTYVERLAYFIRGIDCWAFETERYFGTEGREVQSKRVVDLLPKVEDVTPMMAPFDI
jgi:hypothetical protein